MAAAAKLKQAGITPFAIGTRDLWANDLWFDYLDMRINGLDFHMQLMDGKIKYTDPRVKTVFERWKSVIDKGFFLDNASSYGWQEAIPFLSQGKAGMYLLGAYVMTSLPEEARKNIGYFRFPTVDPNAPDYEEVSVNGALIPTGAKNKEAARKFLAFFAEPENLKQFALAGASLAGSDRRWTRAMTPSSRSRSRSSAKPKGRHSSTTATPIPKWPRSACVASRSSWRIPISSTPSWRASKPLVPAYSSRAGINQPLIVRRIGSEIICGRFGARTKLG